MKHYNPSITERANRIFNLKNGDGMSEEIDGPVAVIPINPTVNILRSLAGNATYVTPSDKDFYLTNLQITIAKSAADTGTIAAFTVVVNGVTVNLLRISSITLTAENRDIAQVWPYPIKIDRGSTITFSITGTYTTSAGLLQGYTEEVTRT